MPKCGMASSILLMVDIADQEAVCVIDEEVVDKEADDVLDDEADNVVEEAFGVNEEAADVDQHAVS